MINNRNEIMRNIYMKSGYYNSEITASNEFKLYRERRVSGGRGVVETTCTSGLVMAVRRISK